MNIERCKIDGVVVITPQLFSDGRGYFYESFSQRSFEARVCKTTFVQDNQSRSVYGVLRGLHFQAPPYAQSKLVQVVKGSVLDIIVDIRRGSPTYGQHLSVELSEDNHKQVFIPRGFAHGFVVLSEEVIFQYKCDNPYNKASEGAICWNDPTLGIDWGVKDEDIILSDRDQANPLFTDFESPFNYSENYYG